MQQELLVAQSELFSGPLPHPNHLAEYEKAHSGLAERIIRMAEEEAEHRRRQESAVAQSNMKLEARGQILAFVMAIFALGAGTYIMASGESVWGAAMAISALAGLCGLSIWTRREKRRGPSSIGTTPGLPAPPSPPRRSEQRNP